MTKLLIKEGTKESMTQAGVVKSSLLPSSSCGVVRHGEFVFREYWGGWDFITSEMSLIMIKINPYIWREGGSLLS